MLGRGIQRVSQRSTAVVRGFRTSAKAQGDHAMFEELPFKKSSVGPVVAGFVLVGVGAVWGSCLHQNKKHGFKGVSSN